MTDKIEDGGPAFPRPQSNSSMRDSQDGMSLRDYFAAKAMQGLLSSGVKCGPDAVPRIATGSYILADAMLRARAKPE
jgi:hypothetical protein